MCKFVFPPRQLTNEVFPEPYSPTSRILLEDLNWIFFSISSKYECLPTRRLESFAERGPWENGSSLRLGRRKSTVPVCMC
jgi:hypothetical protein